MRIDQTKIKLPRHVPNWKSEQLPLGPSLVDDSPNNAVCTAKTVGLNYVKSMSFPCSNGAYSAPVAHKRTLPITCLSLGILQSLESNRSFQRLHTVHRTTYLLFYSFVTNGSLSLPLLELQVYFPEGCPRACKRIPLCTMPTNSKPSIR